MFCIESITVVPLSEKLNPMDATGVDDVRYAMCMWQPSHVYVCLYVYVFVTRLSAAS